MSKCCCGESCCCTNDSIKCDCAIIHKEQVDNVNNNILNNENVNNLCELYKVFSDPTRLKILLALEIERLCVCDIANVLNMTKSAVSHQLKVLREKDLIKFDKEGKNSFYSLANDNIKEIIKVTLKSF